MANNPPHADLFQALDADNIISMEALIKTNCTAIDKVDEDGRTVLHWAAARNKISALNLLLSYNANPNSQDEGKWSPLMSAASAGHTEIVKLLLYREGPVPVDASVKNEQGRSALHYACGKGNEEIVSMLINKGSVPVNVQDHLHSMPLHRAVVSGNTAIIQMLIDAGAKINATDRQGDTPLHLASLENHYEAASVLIANKADPNVENRDKQTPLDVCSTKKMSDILKGLIMVSTTNSE